jgi:phenylacetic acid degradation operon negative regulatory protein
VKDSTKELLALLLWTSDMLARPTFRNLTDSYETWAYRKGFRRQARLLQRQKLLEIKPPAHAAPAVSERVLQLTEEGRLVALGGRDPGLAWKREWDGRWRLLAFDLPASEKTVRKRLTKSLRRRGCGWLQNSVWISPHPLPDGRELDAQTRIDVKSMVIFVGRPCAGETDQEIVSGAWDFVDINRRYARCLEILKRGPSLRDSNADGFRDWIRQEWRAWLWAVSVDPLLPKSLLPNGYLGQEVWKRRLDSSRRTAAALRGKWVES